MTFRRRILTPVVFATVALLGVGSIPAQVTATNAPQPIDLAATLQLAGAQNLEVRLAREKLAEAQANSQIALWQFFPWIAPGLSYRRHENLTQDVQGNIIEVDKELYSLGPALTAQVDLGNAIYNRLASRQLVKAAHEAVQTRRARTVMQAAQAYFDLLQADAALGIALESSRITDSYLDQVRKATEAGIAYQGDVLRVEVQSEKNRVTQRRAEHQRRVASARLVEILHLDSALELAPASNELAPVSLFPTNVALVGLLARARSSRPELREQEALARAADASVKAAQYGPLIPTVGAQVFAGGLGGGPDGGSHTFGSSQDYQVGLSWRMGPGGLFDRGRIRVAESRRRSATLESKRVADEISRQVVENHAAVEAFGGQLSAAQNAARIAEQSLRLSRDRQAYAVGNVLETILSEQELTSARLELARAIAEYNKAQYGLAYAAGGVDAPGRDRQ